MFIRVIVSMALLALADISQAQDTALPEDRSEATAVILLFATDTFKVLVDGEEIGILRKNETKKISVSRGQHLVLALNESGDAAWRKVVTVESNSQIVVEIESPKPEEKIRRAKLLVRTDTPCTIEVNGRKAGKLRPGETRTVSIDSGENILVATSDRWDWWKLERTFYVSEGSQKIIDIELGTRRLFYHGDETATDLKTGLMWVDVGIAKFQNWAVARNACERIELGGHTDWQMPDLEQIQTLLDDGMNDFVRWHSKRCPVQWTSTSYGDNEVYCLNLERKEVCRISTSRSSIAGKESLWEEFMMETAKPRSVCFRPLCVRLSPESNSR